MSRYEDCYTTIKLSPGLDFGDTFTCILLMSARGMNLTQYSVLVNWLRGTVKLSGHEWKSNSSAPY